MKIPPSCDDPWDTSVEIASAAASDVPPTVPLTVAVPERLYVLLPPHAAQNASKAAARTLFLRLIESLPFRRQIAKAVRRSPIQLDRPLLRLATLASALIAPCTRSI